jgi:membrane fusion protein (multidrug efflux system)
MSAEQQFSAKSDDVDIEAGLSTPIAREDESVDHEPQSAQDQPTSSPTQWRKRIAMILLPLALIGALWYGYHWWTVGRFLESTDDAYIGANSATLSAKVSGYVVEVKAGDNAHVKTGAVIARIDDGDYRLAVRSAEDAIAAQRASIERIAQQIIAQNASVVQEEAKLRSAEAGALRANLELKRQKDLAQRDFASRQALETAQANNDQAVASVQSAKAAVAAARANVGVLKAQQLEARGTLKQLQTALEKAKRDLSFTVIRAPFDGVVGNRAMQVGEFVQPGQRLATLVPLNAVYIDANFKETQFQVLHAGQPVDIEVDAVPGHTFKGTVASLAPASGSVFSLLPPDNATGNFTKVVQRLTVRIQVELAPDEQGLLRPGMSVVVTVNTKQAGGDAVMAAEMKPTSNRQ